MNDVLAILIDSLKKNEFGYALRGERGYGLSTPYMCPVSELPTDWDKILMEGVYEIHKRYPSYKIDIKLEESLINIAKDVKGIYSSLNIFWLQLMNEKIGNSPFNIRRDRIIDVLSKKIVENKHRFINDKRWMGENENLGLWGEILRICKIFSEKHDINLICH